MYIDIIDDNYQEVPFSRIINEVKYHKNNIIECKVIDADDSFMLVTGINKKSIIGQSIINLINSKNINKNNFMLSIEDLMNEDKKMELEFYSNKLEKWFKLLSKKISKDRFESIIVDITNKKIELDNYKTLIASFNDIIIEFDSNYVILNVYFNKNRFDEINMKKYKNKRIIDIENKQVNEKFEKAFKNLDKNNITQKFVYKGKNGIYFETEIIKYYNTLNKKMYLAILKDISEKKLIEDNFFEQNQKLLSIFTTIPDMYFVMDENHNYLEFYSSDKSKLYYDENKIIGSNIADIFNDNYLSDLFKKAVDNAIKTGDLQVIEYKLEINNKIQYFESRMKVMNNNNVLAIVRDITEYVVLKRNLKKSNEELKIMNYKLSEALEAKKSLLAKVSHELKTPMNGILAGTKLALQSTEIEQIKKYLTIISQSNDRLIPIIDNLLDFSQLNGDEILLNKEIFEINETINNLCSIYKILAKKKNLDFFVKKNISNDLYVLADKKRFSQIINNILDNSIKFTNEGEVIIDYKIIYKNQSKVKICFVIQDTGIGINKDKLEDILNPFEQSENYLTRKFEGLGLGLTISKELIEKMNGTFSIESDINKGTKVIFDIVLKISDKLPN